MDDPTCPRCGFQGPPAKAFEAQGLIQCGGCGELVEPTSPRVAAPGAGLAADPAGEDEVVEADLSGLRSNQVLQVWMLRGLALFPAVFFLIPIQAPPDEVIVTTSVAFWGAVAGAVALGFAWLFADTEARALALADRNGGTRLHVDAKGLKLPHLATIGPARTRAVKAGRPRVELAWGEVHAVVQTSGKNGRRALRFDLQAEEEAGALWQPDHVFLLCAGLGKSHERAIVQLASRYAGPRRAGGEGSAEVRRGLSSGQLEANQKAVVWVGVAMTLGSIGAWAFGGIDGERAMMSLFVLSGTCLWTYWKIQAEIDRRR